MVGRGSREHERDLGERRAPAGEAEPRGGTWLNGMRLAEKRPLAKGDQIGFARSGPVLLVEELTPPAERAV